MQVRYFNKTGICFSEFGNFYHLLQGISPRNSGKQTRKKTLFQKTELLEWIPVEKNTLAEISNAVKLIPGKPR